MLDTWQASNCILAETWRRGVQHTHRSDVASVDRGIRIADQSHIVDAIAQRCHTREVHDEVCTQHIAHICFVSNTFNTLWQGHLATMSTG